MRKKKLILTMFFTVLCFTTLLSACGEKEKMSEEKTVYHAKGTVLTENVAFQKAAFGESAVCYVADKDGKKTLIRYDVEEENETELPVSFEENETVLQIDCTKKEEIVVLTVFEDKAEFFLSVYDRNGKEVWKQEVTNELKDKNMETHFYLTVDSDGNIFLLNGFNHVCVWNQKGDFQFVLRTDYLTSGIAAIKDTVYTYSKDGDKPILQEIDVNVQKWKNVKSDDCPKAAGFNGCILGEDTDDEIFMNEGTALIKYNAEKGTTKTILLWTDYGMTAENVLAWKKAGEEVFCIVTEGSSLKLVMLSPAKEGDVREKQVVTIGEVGTHGYIENAIAEFNKKNDQYAIQLVQYEGNMDAGIAKQDLDLAAGKGPDIICMASQEYMKYADKGLLEDLYPYMEKDEETGKEDYLSNILAAYERNGKLYGITTSFSIETLSIPTKYAGDKMGVTTEEFIEIVKKLPEDKKLTAFFTDKKMTFRIMLPYFYQQFIDYENYTCNFSSDEFVTWLTFINSIKLVNREEVLEIAKEDFVLGMSIKSSVTDYQWDKIQFKEDEITYLGYPESGSRICANTSVGINSQGKNKEGAWEFIKFLLSEERQDTLLKAEISYFPVRISTLEKECAWAMEPEYETDENGNPVEIPKEVFPVSKFQKEEIRLYAATEEEMKKMKELITSCKVLSAPDNNIIDIIDEEVAAFYVGDKTAEEVATLIQNRVETYLNEIK